MSQAVVLSPARGGGESFRGREALVLDAVSNPLTRVI